MAIAAIYTVIADMMLVAELNGLSPYDVLICEIRCPSDAQHADERKRRQEKRRKDTKSCDEVRASVKNLGHVKFALWR